MSLGSTIDRLVGILSPGAALRRTQQRKTLERMYAGAEANRLTNNKKPRNQAADSELLGPFGADSLRAWARALVRDNAYAWGVVDTVVSSVIGCGISAQSQVETPEGTDIEDVNERRDSVWQEWCKVCDVNGRLTFSEIQQLAQREIVEAGEVLIHLVNTPSKKYRGIYRPVPFAIELVEADRLATDKDTYRVRGNGENKIVRGVELDDLGKPIAYWVYPEHPNGPYTTRNTDPVRYDASEILHLFRVDRIGQSRGVSWFAPVMSWLRDLGVYVDNEIQASAVASCFGVAITTTGRAGTGLMPSTDSESTDTNGNQFEYLEPAMVVRLNQGESIESINPGRPNSASEPWINLMLRGIAVGTGLSYEIVARDYSKTNYSSSRTSQLEDRRRFRRWQDYMVQHACQPIWDRFCDQAATAGVDGFPSMAEILDDRKNATAVEWQTPAWEWVDPQSEQSASDAALVSFQSTYQHELGQRGKNWRNVFYQRAKEEKLKRQLGLVTADMANVEATQAEGQQMAASSAVGGQQAGGGGAVGAGEMAEMSRLQWGRNRKAIEDILAELIAGTASETKAKVFLQTLGLTEATAAALIADASDGTVDTPMDEVEAADGEAVKRQKKRVSRHNRPGDHPGGGGASPAVKAWAEKKFNDPAKAKAFTEWFGDSKVVDEKGEPLTVYHGTNVDFDAFDMKKSSKSDIRGAFFAMRENLAGSFGAKNIIAANIKMNKPATFDDVVRLAKSGVKTPQIHAALQKEGFDGIFDTKKGMVIAFDATSIKSATGNQGTFDPKDPNIKRSIERHNRPGDHDGSGSGGGKKPATKTRTKAKPLSAKAQRAKGSAKLTDRKVQQEADNAERAMAKNIGGASFKNSEPVDIVVAGKSGSVEHGIEHKYMHDNANAKITMNKYAQVRKVVWEQNNKAAFHTVVETKDGDVFYRRGVGSFRVGGMHKVEGGKGGLKKLLAMKDNELPTGAQRTDAAIRQGKWKEMKTGRGYVNTKTGEEVYPKK